MWIPGTRNHILPEGSLLSGVNVSYKIKKKRRHDALNENKIETNDEMFAILINFTTLKTSGRRARRCVIPDNCNALYEQSAVHGVEY